MPESLPPRANIEHLKKSAKELLRASRIKDPKAKLADAQRVVARDWPGQIPFDLALRRAPRRQFIQRKIQLLAQGFKFTESETGWSSRHLASRFRTEIGLTPKAAARVIRFDRAKQTLIRHVDTGAYQDGGYQLADLAADTGYFDQAHLAREFRALAGCPPSQWLAEEFRNVQAGNWLDGESWE